METEIEAKWIAPNLEEVRTRLKSLGAVLIYPECMMKRRTFDFPDETLGKVGGWIRVRDEGNKITLSYKQLNDRTLHGTKEVTVVVSDFIQTCTLLEAIGLLIKSNQETRRETWSYGDCEITLDTWPWIPSVVEIEGKSEDVVKKAVGELGFKWSEAMYGSIENVYHKYYDIAEVEVCHWPEITFVPVPYWLEIKRRNQVI